MLFKNKIKMSLIKDYSIILSIDNFCNQNNNLDVQQIKTLSLQLKNFYESLLKKLKFDELSLLILKKEIKSESVLFVQQNNHNHNFLLDRFNLCLTEIAKNINKKLQLLKIDAISFTRV
ncbi:MAG: hypothetical protein IKM43_00225 [Clostridia bacterium]|nr:hypothetical protein [Clostridia bacterium]